MFSWLEDFCFFFAFDFFAALSRCLNFGDRRVLTFSILVEIFNFGGNLKLTGNFYSCVVLVYRFVIV